MTKASQHVRSTGSRHVGSPASDDSSGPQLRVGRELADTTWRIAVPVVLFAGAGIMLDRSIGSKPWLTLLGMVVGFAFAAVLVKRQIESWPVELRMPKPGASKGIKKGKSGYYEDDDYYSEGKE